MRFLPFLICLILAWGSNSNNAVSQELSPVWPKNNQQVSEPDIFFSWNKASNAVAYNFELYTDPSPDNLVFHTNTTNNFHLYNFEHTGTYYWRIQPLLQDDLFGAWSELYSFTYFNPTSVNELIVWYSAANSISTEGRIVQLTDLSGNNLHATQANTINQPLLIAESLNGNPSIRFNGSNNFLESTFGETYAQPNSIFVLWKTNIGGSRVLLDDFSNLILDINTGLNIRMFAGSAIQYSKASPFDFLITTAIYNTSSSQLFENGQLKASGSSGSNGLPGLSIGRRKVFTDRYFSGDIAELVVINKNPDPIERNKIERYIANKYSSPVNLGFDVFAENFCPQTLDAGERFVSYLWNTGATTQTIEVNTPGNYSVTVTDIFGFQSSDQVQVSYPSTALNNTNPVLCLGETREIFPVLPNPHLYTYQWSTGATTPTLQVSQTGSYWVQITDDQGCTAFSDTLHLTIDEFVNNISLGEDLSICAGNPISLIEPNEPVEIVSYLWSTGENSATIIISESGNYAVTVTNINGCVATDDIDINILGIAPLVNFAAENFCLGNVVEFTDLSVAAEGDNILQWHWSFGEGSNSSEQNPSFIFPEAGSYNVTLWVEAESSCSNTEQQTITIYNIPNTLFSASEGCVNYPVFFQDLSSASFDSNIIDWQWDFGDGNSSSDQNPVHSYLNPGLYEVTLTTFNSNGCFSDYTLNIEIPQTLPSPDSFSLISPKNEQLITNNNVVFHWNFSENAFSYVLTVAEDEQLNNIIANVETNETQMALELPAKPQLFWRIQAYNACRDTIESNISRFSIFNPGSVENLTLWLAADSLVQLTNGKVGVWSDLSGKNQHATQANPTNQPILMQNAINHHPAIIFSGSEFMQTTLTQSYNFPTTIFLVWKAEGNTLQFAIDGLANNSRRGIYTQGSPNNRLGMQTSENLQYEKQLPFNYIITSAIFNFTSSRIFENSLLKTSGSPGVDQPFNGLRIGANFTSTSRLNGAIAEIIVYNSVLADTQRIKVEKYLQAKYSPPINLGPDRRITYGFCPQTLDAGERFVSYLWNTGETSQTIEVNTPGTYSVTVTDIFGFQSSDSLQVRMPQAGLNASQVLLCEGESVELEFVSEEFRAGAQAEVPRAEQFGIRSLELSGASTRGSSTFHVAGRPSPYTFLWSTGEITPSIITGQPGTYTLTVTDTLGCSRQFTATVQVDFFASTASLGEPRPFCMGDTLFVQSEWNPSDLVHAWADGSTEPFLPIHQPGTYQVTVTNPSGCVAQVATTLSFQGYAPVADFTAPPDCLGEATVFTGTATVEGSEIVSYQWFFGDPGNEVAGDTGAQVSYTYSQAGLHPATLQVVSAAACRRSITRPVQVYHLPQGWFTPNNACSDVPVVFSDASTDQEGGIGQWQWSFFDGQGNLLGQSQQPAPSFTFADPGNHRIALEVASLVGCRDSLSRMINVRQSPEVDFSFTTPCLGEAVFFTDHTTAPPWALVSSQQWDFGDGNTSAQSNPSHLYAAGGIYNVTLSVTALNGCRPSLTLPVTVHSPPQADFAAPGLCQNTPHTFQDLSTVENSSISQWQWNFAGQGTSTLPDPEFTFSQPGQYAVSLVATSQAGCTGSITQLVDVYPAPEPQFTFFPRYGVAPLNVSFSNLSQGASSYVWDFGDGTPTTTQPNPVHTFTQNGIYITRLTALSNLGCRADHHQEIRVIPLSIDVAVQQLSWQQQGGFLQISALLSNQGTLEFDTLWLEVQLSGRDPIREKWTGLLRPGEMTQHTFAAQFPWRDSYDFFCVEAYIPRLEQDDNPANNRMCLSFTQDFRLLTPWPNPAQEVVNLGFVLPLEDQVLIQLSDLQGNLIATLYNQPTPRGITTLRLPLPPLSSGIYLYRITYRDETRVGRVMVR